MKALLQKEVQVAESLTNVSNAAISATDPMTVAFLHDFHILQTDEIDEMTKLYVQFDSFPF
jgi:ferritin